MHPFLLNAHLQVLRRQFVIVIAWAGNGNVNYIWPTGAGAVGLFKALFIKAFNVNCL